MNGRPVRVLVVVASRHGATAEIGAAVARDLGACEAGRAAGWSRWHSRWSNARTRLPSMP